MWANVLRLHAARKSYVHPTGQANLFSESAEAEFAISAVRDAVKDIYARAGREHPGWIDDDEDRGWDGGVGGVAHLSVRRAGVDEEVDPLRVTYIYKGEEYESEVRPFDPGYEKVLEELVERLNVPVSEVRAYRGAQLLRSRKLHMRGS